MEDIQLDEKGNFIRAANGDTKTVQDLYCLIQDVKHLLLTFPGDLWQHQQYGAGIQRFVQAEDTELNRLDFEQTIKLAVATDDRVEPESIRVEITSWTRETISVRVAFLPKEDAFDYVDDSVPESQADFIITISANGIQLGGATA
jgi:hypothetical protein